jgi:hypothetical protein
VYDGAVEGVVLQFAAGRLPLMLALVELSKWSNRTVLASLVYGTMLQPDGAAVVKDQTLDHALVPPAFFALTRQ